MEQLKMIIISALVSTVVSCIVTNVRCNRHLDTIDLFVKGTLDSTEKAIREIVDCIVKKFHN